MPNILEKNCFFKCINSTNFSFSFWGVWGGGGVELGKTFDIKNENEKKNGEQFFFQV